MFDVEVDVKDVEKRLDEFKRKGGDLSPSMAIVAEMLVSGVSDEFDSEGQGNWDELKKSTLRKRRKGGAGAKILQDSGLFAGSIQPHHGADFAEASTNVDYAVHHVFGAPKANVPERNPFDIEDRVFDEAVDLILERVVA